MEIQNSAYCNFPKRKVKFNHLAKIELRKRRNEDKRKAKAIEVLSTHRKGLKG